MTGVLARESGCAAVEPVVVGGRPKRGYGGEERPSRSGGLPPRVTIPVTVLLPAAASHTPAADAGHRRAGLGLLPSPMLAVLGSHCPGRRRDRREGGGLAIRVGGRDSAPLGVGRTGGRRSPIFCPIDVDEHGVLGRGRGWSYSSV